MSETTCNTQTATQHHEASPVIFRLLEQRLGAPVFNLWLGNTHFISLDDDTAVLGVQNRFIKNWIERKYADEIAAAIDEICGIKPHLSIKIDGELFQKGESSNVREVGAPPVEPQAPPSIMPTAAKTKRIQYKYKLDTFIGVKENALPLLVSRQFVEGLDNPLYHRLAFFGAKGNGKTHLLKGIEAHLREQCGTFAVKYLTAEAFTNAYVNAIQSKQYADFQKRHNELDVFIIDDIQFLAGKTKTQEGLLSTIKHLESEGRSVVLASDRHPGDIPGLCPNLREFIAAGMLVEVPPPCAEGRMAILKSLCCKTASQCPDSVLDFLAEHFSNSVRELEGALLKVMAYSSLHKGPASIELARQILQPHLMRSQTKKSNVQAMINDVAAIFTADPADLTSRKQDRSTVRARQIAMYVIRRLSDKSYQEIGTLFGGKKYSAVMYAEKVAQKTIDNDPNVARHVDAIIKRYR